MTKHFRVKLIVLTFCLMTIATQGQETETRNLSPFEKISSTASIDVIISLGETHSVKIEAENIEVDKILTEVKSGILTVSMKKGNYWNASAKVYVTLRELAAITLSGLGNITTKGNIESEKLEVQLSSSGNMILDKLMLNELHVKLFGTGDIQLGGSTQDAEIKLSGSGDIQAYDLKTFNCTAEINGSGNINVQALSSIEAKTSGSGDISYTGHPKIEKIHSSGSGEIIAIN